MKRVFFIGIVLLFLIAVVVLFGIQNTPHQEEKSMDSITVTQQEETGIDAILAAFPPEKQDVFREQYETQMRIGKASGNEETIAFFEKTFKESLQKVLNAPDLPEDNHERLEYWEDRIRQAKERGSSEAHIAHLERFRDNTIKLIEVLEKNASEFQAERDHLASLSTHEERIAYYEERLPAAEEALRLAQANGDASDIQWAQWDVEAIKSDIKHEERLLADIPKKAELDALLERAAASRSQMIDQYRHLLHTEVVDGVEHVVGVRTPDEIASSASEKSEGSSFPEEAPSLVPSVSEDVSSSPPVIENTPIPSFEGMPPQPFVKAETQFQSWRNDIDQDYVDVLVSRYMSPQELDQSFPTPQQRQRLANRTERLQNAVVSQIRKIVSAIPDVPREQKRTFARNILTQNFDSEFAQSVLDQLNFDDK